MSNLSICFSNSQPHEEDLSILLLIETCEKEFEQLKKERMYSSLFEHSAIKEMDSDTDFPPMYDIGMDEETVYIVSSKDCPYLGTSGVATCFAVAAKATTSDNEVFIGLAHINLTPPKAILEEMTIAFVESGCSVETIEFYIVGGMLPFNGESGHSDTSFEMQKDFLSLSKEYNIEAVRFNIIEGEKEPLAVAVFMTTDGVLWTTREDALIAEELPQI